MKPTINKFTITIGVSIGLLIIIGFFGIPYLYNEYISATPAHILPFSDVNGNQLRIVEYRSATNPTFSQAFAFLQQYSANGLLADDKAAGPGPAVVRLHDAAEKAGMRAGVVEIKVQNETDVYSLGVFDTADKGMVMVDPTGTPYLAGPLTIVHMDAGNLHTMAFIPLENKTIDDLADIGDITGAGAVSTIKASIVSYTW